MLIKFYTTQRWNTSFYNVTGSRMEELSRQFKAGEIDEKQLKEAARDIVKGYGKDIGIDYEVVYLDESTMPKDAKGSTGSAFINKETEKMLIPIDVNKIKDTGSLWGVIADEVSHIQDGLEGRQDKKVAEDETNKEKGLESLGRPINDYVKNKLGDDNNSKISLTTDGIDLTNADVGEKVGDASSPEDLKFKKYYREEVLPNDPYYKIVKKITSLGTDMIPDIGPIKTTIEILIGYDLLTKEEIDLTDGFFISTSISKGITDQGVSRFEKQIFTPKINSTPKLIEYKPNSLETENQFLLEYKPNQLGTENQFLLEYKPNQLETGNQLLLEYKPPVLYKAGNTSLVLYKNPNLITTPVANNGTLIVTPLLLTDGTNKVSQGIAEATQKVITINNKQNTNPLIKGDGTLNNSTYYVIIESSSEKIKSIDELLTKEGQAKIGNSSMEELQNLFEEAGYKTELTDASGSGGGQRLIIQGHNIGSIRSNTSAGTHRSIYRIISGNFKDDNGGKLPGKIKVIEGTPDSYHTRGNTPEKAEIIFVEKKEENK